VNTAVRFLLNPRVEATSEELKRSFLLKKGLTDLEIEQALALAAQQAVTRPGGVARPALPNTLAPLPAHQLAYNPHTVTVGLYHILLILLGYFGDSKNDFFFTRSRNFFSKI
jgi:hypothetical protein